MDGGSLPASIFRIMVEQIVAFAAVLAISAPGAAQIVSPPSRPTARWGVSGGYNRQPALGIALTGFAADDFRPLGLPLRGTAALDVLLSDDEQSDYARETLGDGESVCRDTTDGGIADDMYCAPEVDLAGRGELMAVVSRRWGAGAGVRVQRSEAPNPYALVRYETPFRGSSWFGQLSVGDHFTQVDVGISVGF